MRPCFGIFMDLTTNFDIRPLLRTSGDNMLRTDLRRTDNMQTLTKLKTHSGMFSVWKLAGWLFIGLNVCFFEFLNQS
jgi:hypothetical protein